MIGCTIIGLLLGWIFSLLFELATRPSGHHDVSGDLLYGYLRIGFIIIFVVAGMVVGSIL